MIVLDYRAIKDFNFGTKSFNKHWLQHIYNFATKDFPNFNFHQTKQIFMFTFLQFKNTSRKYLLIICILNVQIDTSIDNGFLNSFKLFQWQIMLKGVNFLLPFQNSIIIFSLSPCMTNWVKKKSFGFYANFRGSYQLKGVKPFPLKKNFSFDWKNRRLLGFNIVTNEF